MCSTLYFFRFRTLEAEEAFNIACCDEKVQSSILPKDFKHEFSKVCDFESQINFSFHDDSIPNVTQDFTKLKAEKAEAKRIKLLKREEKKAKIAADIKAKMEKRQNDKNVKSE